MIRVLHVSSEEPWRGGEQQIAYLIDGAEGAEHFVFCRKNSAFESYCQEQQIQYSAGSFQPLGIVASAFKLMKYCRKNAIDLVHCHTGKAHLLGYLAILFGLNSPVVASRRIASRPSSSPLTKARYDHPQVKRIICVSEYIRQIMAGYLRDPRKAVTVHSGIDYSKPQPPSFDLRGSLDLPSTTAIVGTVAALTEEKDIPTFLRVAKRIVNSGQAVHFVIVGEGDQRNSLEEMAQSSGLENHVTFAGHVNNPIDYLQQFDLFLFTSKNEGLGTSVLDAFASGVPVIASETGGIPEMVKHELTGLLSAPGDDESFSLQVRKLLEDKEEGRRLADRASDSLDNFSSRHMATQTLQCYRDVLD